MSLRGTCIIFKVFMYFTITSGALNLAIDGVGIGYLNVFYENESSRVIPNTGIGMGVSLVNYAYCPSPASLPAGTTLFSSVEI